MNMSSMTDMVFLLLIFFMVSSSVISNGIKIELPKSNAQTLSKSNVAVGISEDLKYFINGTEVDYSTLNVALESAIKEAKNSDSEAILILEADKNVPTGKTVEILDFAYKKEIKVVLATEPEWYV